MLGRSQTSGGACQPQPSSLSPPIWEEPAISLASGHPSQAASPWQGGHKGKGLNQK